jgi:hypothetical protein
VCTNEHVFFSILGNMAMWAGMKIVNGKEVEEIFVWFITVIRENTSSMKAMDLLPGVILEARLAFREVSLHRWNQWSTSFPCCLTPADQE